MLLPARQLPAETYVHAGKLLVVRSGKVLTDQVIVIRGERIGTQAIEFEWMTRYGMSPLQAIQAATFHAADLMGWADQIGTIEPDKFAAMIAVDQNPPRTSSNWSMCDS